MELVVTIQIEGEDVRAGTLYTNARHGVESASFRYDATYLADSRAFPFAPDMPLTDGALHTQGEPLFRVFHRMLPGMSESHRVKSRLPHTCTTAEASRMIWSRRRSLRICPNFTTYEKPKPGSQAVPESRFWHEPRRFPGLAQQRSGCLASPTAFARRIALLA